MSTPFSISGSVNYPADASLPADAIALAASGAFDNEASAVLKFSAPGSHSVDLGTLPVAGAKMVLVKVDAGSAVSPVLVGINGSNTGKVEVASGGFLLVSNPTPTAGITQLDLTIGSACTVRVFVLG
jgi:hypothetical protein